MRFFFIILMSEGLFIEDTRHLKIKSSHTENFSASSIVTSSLLK